MVALVLALCALGSASGHGLLKSNSRQYLAWKDGQKPWSQRGPRRAEYNPHSMNKGGVCGTEQGKRSSPSRRSL